VTREQAARHFTAGPLNRLANLIRGPVRSIAEVYIPYRMFRVRIVIAGRQQNPIFALDAVEGVLDLFEFPTVPDEGVLHTVETRNVLPVSLDLISQNMARMREKLIAQVRRMVFARGFFKLRQLEIKAEPIPLDFCIPYWVCFRGAGETVHFDVLDAVRRKREGAKIRHLIEAWLRPDETNGSTLAEPETRTPNS